MAMLSRTAGFPLGGASLALALVLSAASACYISNVGQQTCSTTGCGQLLGFFQDTGARFNWGNPSKTGVGGINYEFYYSLAPTTYNSSAKTFPLFQYIAQVAASNVSSCCKACSSTYQCMSFRYFPQDSTDSFQKIMNSQGKYGFTYSPPFPPCWPSDSWCPKYNASDASKPCILFKMNPIVYQTAKGQTCTAPNPATGCYPAVSSVNSYDVAPDLPTDTQPALIDSTKGVLSTSAPACVGKPRSYWGGLCNPYTNGSVSDDPHFVGGDGVRFDFNGEVGRSFCLVSDERIHINMMLSGYVDARLTGATMRADGKALRTWITALAVMWKDEAGAPHTLYLEARKGKEQGRGNGFISTALLDGESMAVPSQRGETQTGAGMAMSLEEQTKRGPFDMDVYALEIPQVISADISLRVAHPLLQTDTEAYAHFNVKINGFQASPRAHGVLGQTLRNDARRIGRALEYKILTSLLHGPIKADGATGTGYLDGKTDDYATSSPLTPDCKFAVYK